MRCNWPPLWRVANKNPTVTYLSLEISGSPMQRDKPASRSNSSETPPRMQALTLRVLVFLVPGHLDRFQPRLIRLRWIISEVRQLRHVTMQIGKANRERVDLGKFLLQLNTDLFGVGPMNLTWH